MDPDDLEPKTKKPPPKNLQIMDIEELQDYIAGMKEEIQRAEAMIKSKQAVRAGADALFKKN
ncbi:MAG: DUF1192 domain-containing protein [Alphaproteobacteria bacterium]|nr:DUF1192 domain-containing protein [Alphaproteobacteria bacterium]